MAAAPDRPANALWTPIELAQYMGLRPATIVSLSSRDPERLPPRVASMSALRWVPNVVEAWFVRQSMPTKRKGGRPRG